MTPEALIAMRQQGLSAREIGKKTGLSRAAVIGRIWRHNNPSGVGQKTYKDRDDVPVVVPDYWHSKTFETWADRKARLKREREA